jgi:hypothetical protein
MGGETTPLLVDRDIGHAMLAKIGFERQLVMIAALGHWSTFYWTVTKKIARERCETSRKWNCFGYVFLWGQFGSVENFPVIAKHGCAFLRTPVHVHH